MRRTLSPVPKPGGICGESTAVAVGSPLSKCSSPDSSSLFASSTQYALNLLAKTGSRCSEKQKPKPNALRRSFLHFFLCFLVGVFLGFITPIASITTETDAVVLEQAGVRKVELYDHVMSANMLNDSMVDVMQEIEMRGFGKLLIVVTTAPMRGEGCYRCLNRLANTLKLVEPPLLWLVVEMTRQSRETSELLRTSGVMYRHLVCTNRTTEVKDPRVHQRNAALSHIEMHRLDGIVYFADDTNIYSTQLFHHMRQIRRFGTWQVAKLKKSTRVATFVGPICNRTQVIGWHTNNVMRRYHADLSGFAFNSTILWDRKLWHHPSSQPIRHLDTVKDLFQASAFIEHVVEGEIEMEGIPEECSEVLVWHVPMEMDQLSSSNATILDPLSIST